MARVFGFRYVIAIGIMTLAPRFAHADPNWTTLDQIWTQNEANWVDQSKAAMATMQIPQLQQSCIYLQQEMGHPRVERGGPFADSHNITRRQDVTALMQYCQTTLNQRFTQQH